MGNRKRHRTLTLLSIPAVWVPLNANPEIRGSRKVEAWSAGVPEPDFPLRASIRQRDDICDFSIQRLIDSEFATCVDWIVEFRRFRHFGKRNLQRGPGRRWPASDANLARLASGRIDPEPP